MAKDSQALPDPVGALTALLVLRWQQWVHRRVEVVTLEDETVASRRVTLHFSIPDEARLLADQDPHRRVVLPLMRLRKRTFTNFDFTDRCGHALSLLIADEANDFTAKAIIALGHAILGEALPEVLRCEIRDIVAKAPDEAVPVLQRFARQSDHESASTRKTLSDDPRFLSLLTLSATNYIVLLPFHLGGVERHTIRFSYDEVARPDLPLGPLRRIQQAVAWKAQKVWVPAPQLGDVASYHLEIGAPEGLQISTRYFWRFTPAGGNYPQETRRGGYQRARFYVHAAQQDAAGTAVINLRPRPSTIVRAASVAAAFSAALLAALGWRAPHLLDHVEATVGLTLLPIGTVSTLAARPFENSLTTSMLFGLRLLALLPGLWALIPAVALVGSVTEAKHRLIWWIASGLSAATALVLCVAWRRAHLAMRRV